MCLPAQNLRWLLGTRKLDPCGLEIQKQTPLPHRPSLFFLLKCHFPSKAFAFPTPQPLLPRGPQPGLAADAVQDGFYLLDATPASNCRPESQTVLDQLLAPCPVLGASSFLPRASLTPSIVIQLT